jgi:hypothetical protein
VSSPDKLDSIGDLCCVDNEKPDSTTDENVEDVEDDDDDDVLDGSVELGRDLLSVKLWRGASVAPAFNPDGGSYWAL